METTNEVIIIDLEATCWENDGEHQKQHSEIIEIGICKLNTVTGKITASDGILVKPVKSKISPFCTKLTSITPQMVDEHGISLAEACGILEKEYGSKQLTWASYGVYDRSMLKEQCQKFGVRYPMSNHHINVKVLFSEVYGLQKAIGMAGALRMLKLPLEGTHHRGVDDAKNIAKILSDLLAG
ncbi:3'-5' exonuclease [Mucilaginibacter myungsuensis]|uniref:Exonuclease domain-containing protein n=1 Tax=Mucilaginibacter myungsuensis TaxID=649104 RepID=A0A929KZI1_9SPHI|nr:3'-5' exonuclease [Mucilaginibacter myungsuensis]MBE9664584.1 exonuclease domain-containing protein [Mucilaginibacter myungsuensis]MDN3601066.1 3'-5' exonuclease [Mucilaginibacter myungsuensis]